MLYLQKMKRNQSQFKTHGHFFGGSSLKLPVYLALLISPFTTVKWQSTLTLTMPTTYNCTDPETVNKAYYVVDKSYYVDGDQVYYICYDDYSMNGSPTLTCDGATGNWTGNYPKCSLTTTTATTTTQPTDGNLELWILTPYIILDHGWIWIIC